MVIQQPFQFQDFFSSRCAIPAHPARNCIRLYNKSRSESMWSSPGNFSPRRWIRGAGTRAGRLEPAPRRKRGNQGLRAVLQIPPRRGVAEPAAKQTS